MAKIILFGGGDGGGIIIGSNGVRPIPPFDPAVRLQLRGLSAILQGIKRVPTKPEHEVLTLLNRISNIVISQVESIIGPLDGENSLIYQDDDGGFTCGSTGKPPIPFPWPTLGFPSINDLIASGVLERELIDFISVASDQKKMKLQEILEDPVTAADKLGIQLSERTAKDLQRLAPSQLEKISDPVDREIVSFFHVVAEDGRYLSTWATRPYETSEQLNVKLSDAAFERIVAGGASTIFDPSSRMNPVAIAVVVGVVIMLVPTEAGKGKLLVKDTSGLLKF